jgi:hypothetical protein
MKTNGVETPPELTPEDERLLDKAWAAVRDWPKPKTGNTKTQNPQRLGWGLNR